MTTHINSEIIDRLYRLASRLRREWANVPLREDFDTSMVLAVVRTIDLRGSCRKDGTRRTLAEQGEFAEALLRRYWLKSAQRDHARYRGKCALGFSDVSVEEIAELPGCSSLYDALRHDISGGESGREVARFLEGCDWRREQVWAMVWWLTGRQWDDIAWLLEDRFELTLPTETVRQWQKKFSRALPSVRAHLSGAPQDGPAEQSSQCAPQSNRISAHQNNLSQSSTDLVAAGIGKMKDQKSWYIARKSNSYLQQGNKMKNITIVIAIRAIQLLSVSALVSSILVGCSQERRGGASDGLTVVAGLDASISWRDRLGQGVMCVAAQAQTMDGARDHMILYRMERTAEEFTGEDALGDPDALEDEVISQLRDRPQVNGTFPAAYLRQAADAASKSQGPVVVELFSDADNDDGSPQTRAELRRIGARLAANRRVKAVWFLGITRHNTAYWRSVLSPLGERLHFCAADEMTPDNAVKAVSSR
ncbi:hypothetical protein CCAX7_35660 [Capsulimonas corticalis]|uniref:Uncharacterized protein n=1 Tax=Capsulimonas corticalis TaxID=2219043 RepID=A0A402D6B0_9BACT|nr:hypothetical protein [Capsulimonas corticalis]BDI31515.1 hypothetical protein CCAX7_35660 [Capsulimonas corticalis]